LQVAGSEAEKSLPSHHVNLFIRYQHYHLQQVSREHENTLFCADINIDGELAY